jgi:hypothetical protein
MHNAINLDALAEQEWFAENYTIDLNTGLIVKEDQ